MIQITKEAFDHFSKNQDKLDEFIREKKGIQIEDWDNELFYERAHLIALHNEVNEFVNECRDVWKYWKEKPIDYEKLKDELVDVIHFLHLNMNKTFRNSLVISRDKTREAINSRIRELRNKYVSIDLLAFLAVEPTINEIYALLLTAADQLYGMTMEEIVEAYDIKNAENYKRQKTGW